jgi:hypothetical protein
MVASQLVSVRLRAWDGDGDGDGDDVRPMILMVKFSLQYISTDKAAACTCVAYVVYYLYSIP